MEVTIGLRRTGASITVTTWRILPASESTLAELATTVVDVPVDRTIQATKADLKVAIDIESSDFEIDDELAAIDRLRERLPDAQIWMVRIGSRSAGNAMLTGVRDLPTRLDFASRPLADCDARRRRSTEYRGKCHK